MENNSDEINRGASVPQHTTSAGTTSGSAGNPRSNMGLVIGLAVLLLLVAGGAVYYYLESQEEAEARAQKEQQLQQAYFSLDSVQTQLDSRIVTIQQLGGDIDSLVAVKAELEEQKAMLRRREITQGNQIKALTNRVAGYKTLLLDKDKEIEKLRAMNTELVTENNNLKETTNQLNQTVSNLNQEKSQLQEKVATASRLKLEDFSVYAVNRRGKTYKDEFRNRQIDKLKIQFTLAENRVAPIEGKELYIRVTGLDGNVLFDVERESGAFTLDGREMFYTARQEVLYDRNSQQVTFMYDKGSDYEKGVYKVEVYTDNYLLGKAGFTVK